MKYKIGDVISNGKLFFKCNFTDDEYASFEGCNLFGCSHPANSKKLIIHIDGNKKS